MRSGYVRLFWSENRPTSVTAIAISPEGKRKFIHIGFESTACVFEPDVSELQKARVVSLGSLLTPPLLDPKVAEKVIAAAKKAGALVCADVVYDDHGSASFFRLWRMPERDRLLFPK